MSAKPDSGGLWIDQEQLWRDLEALSAFSTPDQSGGVTRRAWSEELFAAERWLIEQFESAGLSTHVDAAHNVWAKWEEGTLPAIVTGSHIDSVPMGGRFDGCLGVLGALEAVRALKRAGHHPARQVWIVAWTEEEGSAFGVGLFGSRAFVGDLDLEAVGQRTNLKGETLQQVVEQAGHRWADLASLPGGLRDVAAYLELHVEQGPLLEHEDIPIGVVTDVVGIRSGRIRFSGKANHAGTTPMDLRRDAGVGAARAIVEARSLAKEHNLRATVGRIEVHPGATNVIPGEVSFSLDARHTENERLDRCLHALTDACQRIAAEEELTVSYDSAYQLDPTSFNAGLRQLLATVCEETSTRWREIVSGAGHDAMALARRRPTAMVFVPSHQGVSHAPDEYTTPEACARGAEILAHTLGRLSEERAPTFYWMSADHRKGHRSAGPYELRCGPRKLRSE